MIRGDRPGAGLEQRVASRLFWGIEERLGLDVDRHPEEEELLRAAAAIVIPATRRESAADGLLHPLTGLGVASGIRPPRYAAAAPRSDTEESLFPLTAPPAGGHDAAFEALAAALRADLEGSEVVLGLVREHLGGVPDVESPLLEDETPSISLASFQHLVAAVAGALSPHRGQADPGLSLLLARVHGHLHHLCRVGRLAGSEGREFLVGRALHLHLLVRAMAGHLVRHYDLSPIQILGVDAEGFLVLGPALEDRGRSLERLETDLNRWLVAEYEGRIHVTLDGVGLSRRGLSDLGSTLVSIEARQDLRRRQPLKSLLPELASAGLAPLEGVRCATCDLPKPSAEAECTRCHAWRRLGRLDAAAAGVAIEVAELLEGGADSCDPLLAPAPLASIYRFGIDSGAETSLPSSEPFEPGALLSIHVKDLVPLFAFGEAGRRSLGHFLDVDALVRTLLGVHLPRSLGEAAGRVAWTASARRILLVGAWTDLADFAARAILECQRLGAPATLALAGALVEFGTLGELDEARERAEAAIRRAAVRGTSTIDVLGRSFSWGGQEPGAFPALVELGRLMARALRSGLDPGFLTWLASLSRRHGVGREGADPMWEPALLSGVVRRLRDRRFAELRRTLLGENRERETLLANIDVPVRFALGGHGS